jgi:hypothetical protein
MRYRKKPIEIDAWQWDGNPNSVQESPKWVRDGTKLIHIIDDYFELTISTLEGELTVSPNDYIVKGIYGEVYPCKPNIFEASYEAV